MSKQITGKDFVTPLFLLVICFFSFGLKLWQQGFYLDDWSALAAAKLLGLPNMPYYYLHDNRPLSAWTYQLFVPLLGYRPINWQIFAFLERYLTTLGMWWAFCGLWPQHRQRVTCAAVLFAVYPVFLQTPTAVTFHQIMLQYVLYFVSLGAMIRAVNAKKFGWLLHLLAIGSLATSLTLTEFYLGIELLRPVVLWLALSTYQGYKQRAIETIKNWLPYALLLGIYVVWRIYFMEVPIKDRNMPYMLYDLVRHFETTFPQLVKMVIEDMTTILFTTWQKNTAQLLRNIQQGVNLDEWLAALAGGIVAILYLLRQEHKTSSRRTWQIQALAVGAIAALLGPIPGWMIGRQSTSIAPYDDRFALASMFGAAIFIAALFDILIRPWVVKIVLLNLLAVVAIGSNLINANAYIGSWQKQRDFYWQLTWRAPYIQPLTAIWAADESFSYMGSWATSGAINLLYPKVEHPRYVMYWYFNIRDFDGRMDEFLNGTEIYYRHNTLEFDIPSTDTIGTYFEPQLGSCLWVMGAEHVNNMVIPEISRTTVAVSNLSRIGEQTTPGYPPPETFGQEPEHTWCFYYQKAELARQFSHWDKAIALWEEAQQKGFSPAYGVELLPFIESFAQSGDWEKAKSLSLQANSLAGSPQTMLCSLWQRIVQSTPPSPERETAFQAMRRELSCP
ncbi:MAG: hypothetical protein HPY45_07530 [Anaerolineae bacterium]|nr:hypothetical protein [Anaerolineae bacterium]